MTKIIFLKFAILIAIVGLFAISASAQKEKLIGVDKDGEFHFYSVTKVGDKTLETGMYRIAQVYVNGVHFITIRKVAMNRFAKGMGSLELGDEVARVKCTIASVEDQNKKSKILVRRNTANESIALEVWFRGEKTKHVLPV